MHIDYELLKRISLDENNKKKDSVNDSIVLSSFLKLISNMIFELENLKVNELALITNTINHWIKNKTYSSKKKYKAGTIIEYECGLNYEGELSYRHTGLILDDCQNKFILVVPTTSSKKYIDKSSEKENGLWYYVLVGKKEGFDHECVLLLNNMKVVSKKRIIGSFGNMCKDENGTKFFEEVKTTLMSRYFQKQYDKMTKRITDLEKENEANKVEISKILEENEILKNQVSELEMKNQELIEKCRDKQGKINWLYKKYVK